MNSSSVSYRKFNRDTPDRTSTHEFLPQQFEKKDSSKNIPWKPIGLALFLFLGGTVLLILGFCIRTGHVNHEKYEDRLYPLIVLGFLMFIPGSYHVFIAVNVFLGTNGYNFDDLRKFE